MGRKGALGKGFCENRRTLSSAMGRSNLTEIDDLRGRLKPRARLLGLDVGSKTIGLALSNGALSVATPFETIRRSNLKKDTAALLAAIVDNRVGGLVVGLPINMNGSEGPRCQSVRQFVANLAPAIALPVTLWDERLSSAAVNRMLIEADATRRRRAQVVDKLAAAYILQGALDRMANAHAQEPAA
jgi:putative Holliday junction resolvase